MFKAISWRNSVSEHPFPRHTALLYSQALGVLSLQPLCGLWCSLWLLSLEHHANGCRMCCLFPVCSMLSFCESLTLCISVFIPFDAGVFLMSFEPPVALPQHVVCFQNYLRPSRVLSSHPMYLRNSIASGKHVLHRCWKDVPSTQGREIMVLSLTLA